MDRREALGLLLAGAAAGGRGAGACTPLNAETPEEREVKLLAWRGVHQGQLPLHDRGGAAPRPSRDWSASPRSSAARTSTIQATDAQPGVLFGYAFNISKCKGFRSCVEACINENNLDRRADTQYIRIFEMENGEVNLDDADATFQHEVPAEGHFYLGHPVLPVRQPAVRPGLPGRRHLAGAGWHRGHRLRLVHRVPRTAWPPARTGRGASTGARRRCRSRRGESEPALPRQSRAEDRACVEKCTFCIHRTRQGRLPACAEACPTGARVFGNLLDPDSEIRWVLANKHVFRLKEELGTEPRFWYFTD